MNKQEFSKAIFKSVKDIPDNLLLLLLRHYEDLRYFENYNLFRHRILLEQFFNRLEKLDKIISWDDLEREWSENQKEKTK